MGHVTDCRYVLCDSYAQTHLEWMHLHWSVCETVNDIFNDQFLPLLDIFFYSFACADQFTLESDIGQIIKITQTTKQTEDNYESKILFFFSIIQYHKQEIGL